MGEHLPFTHHSVDFVRMNSVLDHLWDPYMAMREVMRVLKPGGLMFLGVSIATQHTTWTQRPKALAKALLGRKDHHVWHPTRDELHTLVDSVGIEKVDEDLRGTSVGLLLRKPL